MKNNQLSGKQTLLIGMVLCMIFVNLVKPCQSQEALPYQTPKKIAPIEFLGWDYEKIGYTLNPGENLSLSFQNNTSSTVRFPVKWTLKSYGRDSITSGKTELEIKPGQKNQVPVLLPINLQDGPYNLHYSLEAEGWSGTNLFYFDYRKPVGDSLLNLNLVAMIENMDTEGWGRMMLGPLARYSTVRNDFPEDFQTIDAVLVAAEVLNFFNPRLGKLQDYVRQGGTAIVFGKTASVLNRMLPVKGSDQILVKGLPLALKPMKEGPWDNFEPASDVLHYNLHVKANADTRILAQWTEGSPAVVEGKYGLGKVIYVGTGTYQVWQKNRGLEGADEMALRLIYYAKGGSAAVNAMLTFAKKNYNFRIEDELKIRDRVFEGVKIQKPDTFMVISNNNIGRFGWLINEGGLTENLGFDGRVTTVGTHDWAMRNSQPMQSDNRFTFALNPEGLSSPKSKHVSQNWFSKSTDWIYANGEKITTTLSLGSPAMLWEGKSSKISMTGSKFTHVAFQSGKGIEYVRSGETIDPSEIKGNWLLTFMAEASVGDMPQLIVLTKRPKKITFKDGLHFEFSPDGFGAVFTSRLYGIKRLAPGATLEWTRQIPQQVIMDAQQWGRLCLDFPVDCEEVGWVSNNTIQIADKIRFKQFKNDWKIRPLRMSCIPPVYILAKKVGAPVKLPKGLKDLHCPTKYGPLQAVEGSFVMIGIDNPPSDHRAIVPVEGRMELKDIINRNVTGLALNTSTYSDQNIRNEGSGRYNADLIPYDYSRSVPFYEAPQIDLYKWWYTFNSILARPVYSDSIRIKFDRHFTTRYWETINFYPHKSLVVQKREPFTGNEYMVTFVWPTQSQFGFRNFNDINEAAGVNAYCYTSYARYFGDWTTLKSNWNLCRELYNYLACTQDWACLSSGALESWGVAGLDMLNSEAYGSLTYGYAADKSGFKLDALKGKVMGTRSLITTVARLGLQSYLASISAAGDPWLQFNGFEHFNEMGMQLGKRKFGSVGWLDTSKGAMHELSLGYKIWAPRYMTEEQKALESNGSNSSCDLTQRLLLGWSRDTLLKKTYNNVKSPRERQINWQSSTALYDMALLCVGDIPVFLSEWTPAEYISGKYMLEKKEMELHFQSHLGDPFSVRIYSQYQPKTIQVNGVSQDTHWKYEDKTGWLNINLTGNDKKEIKINFGEAVAPLHPYFTTMKD